MLNFAFYLFIYHCQEGPPGTKARVKPIQEALITHVLFHCFISHRVTYSSTWLQAFFHSFLLLGALMTDTVRNALNPTRLGCITLKGLKTLLWYHCLSPAACASTDSLKSYILTVTQKYDKISLPLKHTLYKTLCNIAILPYPNHTWPKWLK